MSFRPFKSLPKEQQRETAIALAVYLLSFFGQEAYNSEQQLQRDFSEFQRQSYFLDIIDAFEKEFKVDIGCLLSVKRWKLCKVCNRPFIAYDASSHSVYCNYQTYRKYTSSGKQVNSEGKSVCWVVGNQQRSMRYVREKRGY